MKKILISFLMLFTTIMGYSQIPYININPSLGLNNSNLESTISDQVKSSNGYKIGLAVEIGDKHFLEPGAYYVSYSSLQTVGTVTESLNFSTTQLQLYYGFKFMDLGLFKMKFHTGPTYEVVGKVETNNLNINKEDFKDGKWGGNVGLGAQVLFFTVFFDYNFGLSESWVDSSIKQDVFTLSVGLSIL